jgi:ribosome-associated translation inhibitor RaiA
MMIHARKITLPQTLRDHVERRLSFALGRFGNRIDRVTVWLEDLNGPRGGVDKRCRIEACVLRSGRLQVEVADAEIEPAVDRAADRIARRVKDDLDRMRQTRMRGVSRSGLE